MSPVLNPVNYLARTDFKRVVYGGGEIDYPADLRYHIAVACQNARMRSSRRLWRSVVILLEMLFNMVVKMSDQNLIKCNL